MVLDFSSPYLFPRHFDRLLGDFFRPEAEAGRLTYPLMNLSEDEKNVYVRCEVPGVRMDDIELTLTDKTLVIKGERTAQQGKYFRQERPAGGFQRVVRLNVALDREAVTAALEDGLLTVTLPKAELSRPRKISIDAS